MKHEIINHIKPILETTKNGLKTVGKIPAKVKDRADRHPRIKRTIISLSAVALAVGGYEFPYALQVSHDPLFPAHFQKYTDPDSPDGRKETVEYLERSIESQFGVNLLSPEENPTIESGNFEPGTKPAAWTLENLRTIRDALMNLPDHFYRPAEVEAEWEAEFDLYQNPFFLEWAEKGLPPEQEEFRLFYPAINVDEAFDRQRLLTEIDNFKKNGGRSMHLAGKHKTGRKITQELNIQFVSQPPTHSKGERSVGEFQKGKIYKQVLAEDSPETFANRSLDTSNKLLLDIKITKGVNYAVGIITHELAHNVFLGSPELYAKLIYDILGVTNDNEFHNLLSKTDYFSVSRQNFINNVLREKSLSAGFIRGESDIFFLKYGARGVGELNSVMAQFYTRGQEDFMDNYALIFGEEKALALYDYTKNYIFRGKDYSFVSDEAGNAASMILSEKRDPSIGRHFGLPTTIFIGKQK